MRDDGGVRTEFERVRLGDKRLDRRLLKIVGAMERAPSDSIVEQSEDIAALEGAYRFFANDRVDAEVVFDGHLQGTAERAASERNVLVIHDTTEFRFGGAKEREGLGRISNNKREGFLAHYSICASLDGRPLGTLGLYAWSRLSRGKKKKGWGDLLDPDRESLRWSESVERCSLRLRNVSSAIHVMDREADQFGLFAEMMERGERFVIRMGHDRRLKEGRGRDGSPMLNEKLGAAPLRFSRRVRLGRRERERATKKRNVYPEREARDGVLEVRAQRFSLYRSHQLPAHLPKKLPLSFVEVREKAPPTGAVPVLWRIISTEPIDTDEQVEKIVDIYRKRWLVEEFFKAIKTGCRFEAHQLENIKGLLLALCIESVIAWRLLLLRHLERKEPSADGATLLSEHQRYALCRLRARRGLSSEGLTVRVVLSELANLGSHLKNNGPPGWLVLKRGLRKLEILAEGIALENGGRL